MAALRFCVQCSSLAALLGTSPSSSFPVAAVFLSSGAGDRRSFCLPLADSACAVVRPPKTAGESYLAAGKTFRLCGPAVAAGAGLSYARMWNSITHSATCVRAPVRRLYPFMRAICAQEARTFAQGHSYPAVKGTAHLRYSSSPVILNLSRRFPFFSLFLRV